MSEIDLLIKIRPQIKNFAESIGEQLAKNYHKGLNGPYHDRLSKGIEIAVRAKADQLVSIINSLLDDRERRNAKTIIVYLIIIYTIPINSSLVLLSNVSRNFIASQLSLAAGVFS